MKVIFNYATRQFEPMEPTLRERFALGGGVIQGDKVGNRENFAKPIAKPSTKPRIPKEELIRILNELKDLTDAEVATRLNKNYSTLRGKEFNANNIFGIRKELGIETTVGKVKPEVAEKVKNINQFLAKEIKKANDGDKFVSKEDMVKKVYKKFDLKPQKSQIDSRTKKETGPRMKLDPKAYPVLATLETMPEKVDNVLKRMLLEEKPLNDFWHKALSKRTGIGKDGIRNMLARKEIQTYNVLKNEGLDFLLRSANRTTFNFLKGLSLSEQLEKSISMMEGKPVLVTGETKRFGPRDKVFDFAFRSWNQNRGQGDIQFFDKNGTEITWDFGKQIKRGTDSFSYQGKKYSYQALNDTSLVKKDFPEVYEKVVQSNTFKNKRVDNPFKPGSKITVKNLAKKILVDGYGYSPKTKFSLDILHGKDGVKLKPFTDLRYNTRDINAIEMALFRKLNATDPKLKISKSTYNKAMKVLNSAYKGLSNVDIEKAIVTELEKKAETIKSFKGKGKPFSISDQVKKLTILRNTAQNVFNNLPLKGLRIVPGAAAAAIDYGVFAGLLGTPIDEAMIGASGWLTKRPELGKALGTIATQYSEGKINLSELKEKSIPILKQIGKEQFELPVPESKLPPVAEELNERMGEGTIKIADEVPEPESAERRRMFEEANERFGNIDEMEISDIDSPFMAAIGGRVGFKDGTPDPFVDQLVAALENPNVANQFLKDNQPSVGEMILGKEGDRSLMQSFNTQFLDPRSYPYYAQKTLRGAANIPELAVRFPLAAAYIFGKASLATSTADLSKFSKEDLNTAMEILEPKFTNLALEGKLGDVLGLSPEAIQAAEEKRTGPQKTTGDLLQFTGEAVGPATPLFLFKIFPKLSKQIKDLVGTATAADKVNKEIESRMATQGVDQTRRDLLIATGVGGAVGLLKMLGLDNLFKAAPKAVAKQAPEIITSGGTPKYFFDFVNLIKKKGKDISEEAAIVERQRVYDYNGYTLYENLDTNTIRITKDTEGASSYYVGDGEYDTVTGIIRKEEITYTPKETILNDKGKPVEVKDTYDEATVKPDYDGKEGDYEAGLDSIDEILDLLSKDGKTYSEEELLKMGIDPKLTNVPTGAGTIPSDMIGEANPFKPKVKKAGGGIMKMAGDESGPPPKSGPTPHGLPYVAKNVRPIKERK